MPPKRGPNWLPPDDEQLAKSWLKISEDVIRSTGQKKEEFWKRVAKDFNVYATGVEREWSHCMHRWGHIQKSTLKFSGIYGKLEKTRPSGSVLTDLLPDAKKAYYEQEGKQFPYEWAWMVLKDSPKWNDFSEIRTDQVLGPSVPAPTPSTPGPQSVNRSTLQSSLTPQPDSGTSWKRPPGVHTTKRSLMENNYNMKKMKLLLNQASDYRDQTLAMKKTNKIRSAVAKAEVNQTNMEIMSKKIEDLPDEISQEFLRLQKKMILQDMREQVEERRWASKYSNANNEEEHSVNDQGSHYSLNYGLASLRENSSPDSNDEYHNESDEVDPLIDPLIM